jgi:hypothetical protein
MTEFVGYLLQGLWEIREGWSIDELNRAEIKRGKQ